MHVLLLPLLFLDAIARTKQQSCASTSDCGLSTTLSHCPSDWSQVGSTCFYGLQNTAVKTAIAAFSACSALKVGGVVVEASPYLAVFASETDLVNALGNAVLPSAYWTDPPAKVYVGVTYTYPDNKARWIDGSAFQPSSNIPWCTTLTSSSGQCVAIQIVDPSLPQLCYDRVQCNVIDANAYQNFALCAADLQDSKAAACPSGWRTGYDGSCHKFTIALDPWNDEFCSALGNTGTPKYTLAKLETIKETMHVAQMMQRCYTGASNTVLYTGAFVGLTSQGYGLGNYHWTDGASQPQKSTGTFLDFDNTFYAPYTNECASLVVDKGTNACQSPFNVCLHGNICNTGKCNAAIFETIAGTPYTPTIDPIIWNDIYAAKPCNCPKPPAASSTIAPPTVPQTTSTTTLATKPTTPPPPPTRPPTTANPFHGTCADIDCAKLPNGNYNDPLNGCTQFFFMCSNKYCYKFDCPLNIDGTLLYYNKATNSCEQRKDVPACNH